MSKNNRVWFVNPPGKWSPLNFFRSKISERKAGENLFVLSYSNFLPYKFYSLNNKIVSRRILDFFKSKNLHIDIFWSFDPLRLFIPGLLGSRFSVFHAVDKYLFQYPTELILHAHVDCFIVVAEEFKKQYEPYKKPVLFIPHGVPSAVDSIQDESGLPIENYIFYMGMIDGRLDYPLIEEYLVNFPNEKFLFVGDFKNVDHPTFKKIFITKEYSNLIHLPAVHALKLKKFIDHSKCCIAPMEQDWAGNMISHHKILQYMASGKAVFSPVFSAYNTFSDLLYMQNDKKKLLELFRLFLEEGENSEQIEKRRNFALQHSYHSHVQKALSFIYSSKSEK